MGSHTRGKKIADELAIHVLYNCKGSGGLKPCLLCSNVFNKLEVRDIVNLDTSNLAVHHTEHDSSKLLPTTSGYLASIVRRLKRASTTLNKGQWEEIQTRLGWNYDDMLESRLLLAPPHTVLCLDWMHTIFVKGCFNVHVGCLMWALGRYFKYETLHAYASKWKWPGRFSKIAKDVFCPQRAKSSWEAGHLKCSASEGLCMLPV